MERSNDIMSPECRKTSMSIDMSSSSAKKRKLSLESDFKDVERTYATLKALLLVPSFTNWLQSDNRNCNNDSCIICSMAYVLQLTKQSTSPVWIRDIDDKLQNVYNTCAHNHDFHEFLPCVIEKMHRAFLPKFQWSTSNEQTTPISKLFYGTLRSSAKCSSCQHETVEEIPLEQLTLNINEVDTIEEALENHFASQILSDTGHKCPSCKRNVPATKQLSFQQHPNILCVQFKASDENNKYISKHIETSPEIDISKYSCDSSCSNQFRYRLVSMITIDKNSANFDYYSPIECTREDSLFRFDDESVEQISFSSLNENPYIVFYELVSTEHKDNSLLISQESVKVKHVDQISSGMHIFNLNDECLYEIFKNCTLTDLCSVAEANTKLKRVANEIFARKYKICRLDEKFMKKFVRGGKIIPRMLMNFGAQISEFWINAMSLSVLGICIMNTMIRYCSGTVEKLKLLECHRDYTRPILRNTFPNLKHFVWQCNDNAYQLDNFLSRHRNLETLTISCCDDYNSLLFAIAINCKQLVELDVEATDKSKRQLESSNDIEEKALKSFVTLQKLKKLRIHFPGKNVTEFVQLFKDLKNLHTLEIVGARADSYFVPNLSQLEQLHVLRLVDCSELEYLDYLNELIQLKSLSIRVKKNEEVALNVVQLIKSLINLETLYIGMDTFKMDKTTYYQIVDVVRGRPNGRNSIEIECAIEDTDVYFLQSRNNVKLNWWSM